ncbi:MAG: hypothetical protein ACI959_000827 [Limisphaerales bacterium]|jgi:hypothetical protein
MGTTKWAWISNSFLLKKITQRAAQHPYMQMSSTLPLILFSDSNTISERSFETSCDCTSNPILSAPSKRLFAANSGFVLLF